MAAIFPRWTNRIPFYLGIAGPIVALVVIGAIWYWFSPQFTDVGYRPTQPVPFSHQRHVGELGMDCRYCHNTVEKAAFAAIPPSQTCMNCHSTIFKDSPRLAPIRESVATGKAVEWTRVHMLPDYAFFDHSAHVGAGVGCVSCHGRVDQMPVVTQQKPLSMAWCLDCHRNPTPNLRPRDQVTNMKWDVAQEKYNPSNDPHRTRAVNPPLHCSGCHR